MYAYINHTTGHVFFSSTRLVGRDCAPSKMSSEFGVPEEVKELIDEIVEKYNLAPIRSVKYSPGTELGDGYASKHVAVDIIRENDTVRFFIKYAMDFKTAGDMPMEKLYINEAYFYNEVYPAFREFLREKGAYTFDHVPKCFATTASVVALENIKDKGFVLFNRRTIMNDAHISLVLKAFAKFHAVGFAFKDQKRSEYEKMAKRCDAEVFVTIDSPMIQMFRNEMKGALDKLDPERDKRILEKCDVGTLARVVVDIVKVPKEYSIITKGDCWCNNIMFLYEKEDRENPVDVMLVDWQMIQITSLVFDMSYFFFTVASTESLSKLDSYLDAYYSHLSDYIAQLGSDPKVLYPRTVFDKEWKQHCKYGFVMTFIILKAMLANAEEMPKFDEIDFVNVDDLQFFTNFQNYDEYIARIRTLAEFCVSREYI